VAQPVPVMDNGQDVRLQTVNNPCLTLGVPKSAVMSSQAMDADSDAAQECAPSTMMLAVRSAESEKQGKSCKFLCGDDVLYTCCMLSYHSSASQIFHDSY
jgi:hypothetical protein